MTRNNNYIGNKIISLTVSGKSVYIIMMRVIMGTTVHGQCTVRYLGRLWSKGIFFNVSLGSGHARKRETHVHNSGN